MTFAYQRALSLMCALGLEVDVHDPEALRRAVGPLEVVEQRPDEVSAHVDALFDRGVDGLDVGTQIVDAQRIRQTRTVQRRRVEERGAILGDIDRQSAVTLRDPDEVSVSAGGHTSQPVSVARLWRTGAARSSDAYGSKRVTLRV